MHPDDLDGCLAAYEKPLASAPITEVCRWAVAQGDWYAQAALRGLDSVLAGTRESFVWEYPCHAPGSERWLDLMTRFVRVRHPLNHR